VRRVALLTPLPPAKSGIAHYSSLLLSAFDAEAFGSPEGYDATKFDRVIYQLGNNPHHEWIYSEALRHPDVIVLHDLVLHHLIVEMTLARGDAEAYAEALRASHGAAGEAWARGRAAGLHSEMGNFLLPASVEVARKSRAVIVHNQWAADRLRSFGVDTPIVVVPHLYVPETRAFDRAALRASLGFRDDDRVIGFFGFLTSAKRAEVVLEAFRVARASDPRLQLLIVGEPAPNIDVASLAVAGVRMTGYVSDDDFPAYYVVADRFVNLRYPTAGETSGTLIRALDAGKPVAVSDYAQFAEFPDDCVTKLPLGGGEVEGLVSFFLAELASPAEAQRGWLEGHARLELTVAGYEAALAGDGGRAGSPHHTATGSPHHTMPLPIFPSLAVDRVTSNATQITLTLRNSGDATLPTRTYGQPVYRLIAKVLRDRQVIQDRWLELPCDLRPNATTEVTFAMVGEGDTLTLHHAMQDIPMLDPEPFAEVALVR
jgi:glycosyltransferase involved in cell wall biosynthesis